LFWDGKYGEKIVPTKEGIRGITYAKLGLFETQWSRRGVYLGGIEPNNFAASFSAVEPADAQF
jgi:hypothetical protein